MALETVLQGMVLLSQVTVVEKGRGMQDSTRESLESRCNRVITVDLLRSVGQFDNPRMLGSLMARLRELWPAPQKISARKSLRVYSRVGRCSNDQNM